MTETQNRNFQENDKSSVKVYDAYSLADLKNIWESGWENYKMFCEKLGFQRGVCTYVDDKTKIQLLLDITREILQTHIDVQTDYIDLMKKFIIDHLFPKEKSSQKIEVDCDEVMNKCDHITRMLLKTLLNNLIKHKSVLEANIETFQSIKAHYDVFPSWLKEHISRNKGIVSDDWKTAFGLILKALNNKISEPEVFWRCAWKFTKIKMEYLITIENKIIADYPLSDDEFDSLNCYIRYGIPQGYWFIDQNGKQSYKLYLDIEECWINMYDLSKVATLVLVQPAFQIAQLLQQKTLSPRYVGICRAPSCHKRFYTGRQNATSCPGSQGNKKNKCALEWIRFKRYLEKTGSNPEESWEKKSLQEEFMKYDKQ